MHWVFWVKRAGRLLHFAAQGDGIGGAGAGNADGGCVAGAPHTGLQRHILHETGDEIACEGVPGGGGIHGMDTLGSLADGFHARISNPKAILPFPPKVMSADSRGYRT